MVCYKISVSSNATLKKANKCAFDSFHPMLKPKFPYRFPATIFKFLTPRSTRLALPGALHLRTHCAALPLLGTPSFFQGVANDAKSCGVVTWLLPKNGKNKNTIWQVNLSPVGERFMVYIHSVRIWRVPSVFRRQRSWRTVCPSVCYIYCAPCGRSNAPEGIGRFRLWIWSTFHHFTKYLE